MYVNYVIATSYRIPPAAAVYCKTKQVVVQNRYGAESPYTRSTHGTQYTVTTVYAVKGVRIGGEMSSKDGSRLVSMGICTGNCNSTSTEPRIRACRTVRCSGAPP